MREVKICRFNGIKLNLTRKEEYLGKILIKTGTLLIIYGIKMRKRI